MRELVASARCSGDDHWPMPSESDQLAGREVRDYEGLLYTKHPRPDVETLVNVVIYLLTPPLACLITLAAARSPLVCEPRCQLWLLSPHQNQFRSPRPCCRCRCHPPHPHCLPCAARSRTCSASLRHTHRRAASATPSTIHQHPSPHRIARAPRVEKEVFSHGWLWLRTPALALAPSKAGPAN